jgi:hypothetical protein
LDYGLVWPIRRSISEVGRNELYSLGSRNKYKSAAAE